MAANDNPLSGEVCLVEAVWDAWIGMLDAIDKGKADSLTRASARRLRRWLIENGQELDVIDSLTYHKAAAAALDGLL